MAKSETKNPAFEKTQEFMSGQIDRTEQAVESMIEFNSALFKGGEAVAKKFMDNCLENISASFDSAKDLNKAKDPAELMDIAGRSAIGAAEKVAEQSREMAELTGNVMKETAEAARLAVSKGLSGDK